MFSRASKASISVAFPYFEKLVVFPLVMVIEDLYFLFIYFFFLRRVGKFTNYSTLIANEACQLGKNKEASKAAL